ncbi:VOC family protein [Paenibacillus endoradicis]|uniref:VOC family protein n=1 Tax=Paenibacillus endoradicis TaxID=2972487 RepID=UPI0021598FF9|nr:VOC family protein [Paenibacillus endoradicis]MCR8660395.1 VOC family protein [Paenibacillus endoradicis]
MKDAKPSVHHIGMTSYNFDQTIKFYQEGLGFTIKHMWGRDKQVYMMDMGDGACIEVFEGGQEETPPMGRWLHVAIRTNDIQASYQRAIAAGAKPKLEPTYADILEAKPKPVYMYFAYVIGFDGEEIEFIQELDSEQ